MLTIDLAEHIDSLLADVDQSYLVQVLRDLSANMDQVFDALRAIGQGGDPLNKAAGQLHNRLAGFHATTSQVDPRRLFQSIELVHDSLSAKNAAWTEKGPIETLIGLLDKFAAAYGDYLKLRTGLEAANTLVAAYLLHTTTTHLSLFLRAVRRELWAEPSLPEGFAKLSIVLSAQMTLRDIAQRLVALDEMYETLARLAGDGTIEPLQVGKIETGSFWAWVAGKTKIIAVMSSLLQEKAKRLHWNWRLYGVPRRADAIEEVLDLTKHLKDIK
jgi:hypothetical protein